MSRLSCTQYCTMFRKQGPITITSVSSAFGAPRIELNIDAPTLSIGLRSAKTNAARAALTMTMMSKNANIWAKYTPKDGGSP